MYISLANILFFILGGIITGSFFIMGFYYLIKTKKEKKYTCRVYGKVVNNIMREEKESDYDNHYRTKRYWYALCEYTVGTTKCARQTNIGTTRPKYEIGQTVTIYYNPNNCHESYIEGDNNSKTKAIVCFIIGIILIFFIYFIKKMFS